MRRLKQFITGALVGGASCVAAAIPAAADGREMSTLDLWQLQVGAIYLHRDAGENSVLFQDAADPARNLTSSELGDLGAFGLEAALRGPVGSTRLEFRGILTAPAESSANENFGAPTLLRINTFVPFFIPGVTSIDATRETSLVSFEANVDLFRSGNRRVFAGLRGVSIDDDLVTTVNAVVLPSVMTQSVSNRMIGPQIGAEAVLSDADSTGFRLSLAGRIGYLHNNSSASSILDTGIVTVTAAQGNSDWTAMAELGLNATWQTRSGFEVSLGYGLIYFNDLGSSTASIPATNYFTGQIPSYSEDVLYHGLRLQAVLRF